MKPIDSRTSFHLCSPELVASSTRSSTAQRRTSLTATYATLRTLAQNRFGATALDVALREDASQMARPEEHEQVIAYLREEERPMAELPPAERAIRKVRAAKLAERQQQEALQRMPNLL